MPNRFLIAALVAAMALTSADALAASKKKKKPAAEETQTEESANKEIMDDMALDIAAGLLGGAMKKGKMPKGGKELIKHGLKAAKDAAKKNKDGGKSEGGGKSKKKDPLKALFGGDDEG